MTYDQMLEIIIAAKDGKEIETYQHGNWVVCTSPAFNFAVCSYRVKPKQYKIGDIFKNEYSTYILALVEGDEAVLISLYSGNRFIEPEKVDIINWSISEEAFKRVSMGQQFTSVDNPFQKV
jgi:hypothetical protein